MTAPPAVPPPREALAGVLDRMEAWRDEPGTIPLHDAAWTLLTAWREDRPDGTAGRDLAEVLAAWPDHPAAQLLRPFAPAADAPASRPRGLEEVVAGIRGLPAVPDLGAALERHLSDLAEQRRHLARRGDELAWHLGRARHGLDLAVGALVVVAILALVGWAAALGWITVPETPALPVPDEASAPAPRPEPPR